MAKRRGRGGLIALLVLVALGVAAYLFRDRIPGPWAEAPPPMVVSEAAADEAQRKLEELRAEGKTVRLNAVEFTSLLRYRNQGMAGDLETPEVVFEDSTLRLLGRFPTDRIPESELGEARAFLPDTALVDVRGTLRTVNEGRAAVRVSSASFARIPIPSGRIPGVLARMGRADQPGLQPDEYPFQLPPGVGTARIEKGEMVLIPAGER